MKFLCIVAFLSTFVVNLDPALGQPSLGHPDEAQDTVRIATFNVSMNRGKQGQLLADLKAGDEQIRKVAGIIRIQRPDILLVNEFDYDAQQAAVDLFCSDYLQSRDAVLEGQPIHYEFRYSNEVNTGQPSGLDLNNNGSTDDPNDAFGFGQFPGQYGMLVLSRFPIKTSKVRTFQNLRWSDMPDAAQPIDPESGMPWYSDEAWNLLRLSSKSHWDVPIDVDGKTIHLLASHPTPPAFDGPEDRNGRRNHDEIRLWADYLNRDKANWIVDDSGLEGGLPANQHFIIAGDLNADPQDGGSYNQAIRQLLDHSRVNGSAIPSSEGGVSAAQRQGMVNLKHRGSASHDTADFSDRQVGNLRVDYVIPSRTLNVARSGVFWPKPEEPGYDLIDGSDHRMVWIDVKR